MVLSPIVIFISFCVLLVVIFLVVVAISLHDTYIIESGAKEDKMWYDDPDLFEDDK